MKVLVLVLCMCVSGCASTKIPKEELKERSQMRQTIMNVCSAGLCY